MMKTAPRFADKPACAPRTGAAANRRADGGLPWHSAGHFSGAGQDGAPVPGPASSQRPSANGADQAEFTRVLVVDDHAIVREGIASVLETDPRIAVVGEAGDGIEALELLQQLQADVVLMDVNMPRMNGIEATREIQSRWPGLLTVGLSVQSDPPTADLMREAGAAGFIPKSGDSEEMIGTILQVIAERDSHDGS